MGLADYIGPMPTWAWIAAAGGGFLLYEHHKNSTGSGGLFEGMLTSASDNPGVDNPTVNGQAVPTNDDWARTAVNDLVAGGADPLQAATAIGSYLNHDQLDPSMATLVSAALTKAGEPPEGVIAGNIEADNAPVLNTPHQPKTTPHPSSTGKTVGHKTGKSTAKNHPTVAHKKAATPVPHPAKHPVKKAPKPPAKKMIFDTQGNQIMDRGKSLK